MGVRYILRTPANIGRAIYTAASGRRLIVLHAFVKKTQKTPQRAIDAARRRMREINTMTRGLDSVKKKMLVDREVRTAYAALDEEFALARELIAARVRVGFTQAQLAQRMGTTQSVIARLESGAQLPSVKTLLRFAKATDSRPVLKLRAA